MSSRQQLSFPWEEARGPWSGLKAFLPTCGLVLFKPFDFFRRLKAAAGRPQARHLRFALVFALAMGYLRFFSDALQVFWLQALPKDAFPLLAVRPVFSLSSMVLGSPVFLLRPVLVLAVMMGIVVLGVKFVLGFDKLLLPALLVVCYKSAADILYLVPFVGGTLAVLWSVVLLVAGLREMYSIGLLRSAIAGVLVPLMILFSVLLAVGPALNGVLLTFYPEAQPQWMAFNDLNAFVSMKTILASTEKYREDLGFYPAHLGVLEKYLGAGSMEEVARSGRSAGYGFGYARTDDEHFVLTAKPLEEGWSGRFKFFADQSGQIRLEGADGPPVSQIADMQRLMGSAPAAGGSR
jgi:hypothetical protein